MQLLGDAPWSDEWRSRSTGMLNRQDELCPSSVTPAGPAAGYSPTRHVKKVLPPVKTAEGYMQLHQYKVMEEIGQVGKLVIN